MAVLATPAIILIARERLECFQRTRFRIFHLPERVSKAGNHTEERPRSNFENRNCTGFFSFFYSFLHDQEIGSLTSSNHWSGRSGRHWLFQHETASILGQSEESRIPPPKMGVISGIKDKGVLFGDVAYRTSCSFKNRGLPKMVSWCRCMSSLSLNTEPVGRGIVCIPGRFRIPVQTYPTCPDCIQTTRRLRTEDCCKDQKLRVHFNISAAFLCGEEALILSDKI